MSKPTPAKAYRNHKNDAARRGIPFLSSFDEWLAIWQQSGHWDERGCRRGEYVIMARFRDRGGHSIGNVRIITSVKNLAEQNTLGRDGAFAAKPLALVGWEAFTVSEFCKNYKITNETFYRLQKEGRAPRTFKIGPRAQRIRREAAAVWHQNLTAR